MKKNNLIINNLINDSSTDYSLKKKLLKKFNLVKKSILKNLDDKKNFYNVFNENFELDFKIKDLKKFKKFQNIAIIGMGGSILGSEAIYEFLSNIIKKKLYFFDNIDSEKLSNFKKKVDFRKTLFLIVSKSGNTIETLSNLFLLKILKKDAKNIIIISEKKNNFLYLLSKSNNLFFIEHKKFIGGRYSVLSEVSLVPAYLMGLNISNFRKNLRKYLVDKKNRILKENTIKLARLLLKKRNTNLILLNYSPRLEKLLYWCQQLIAESLGKKGKGFLPVISNAPKDHHSLLQLYLEGPKDKLFYIFSSKENSKDKIKFKKFGKLDFLDNKNLSEIKDAQRIALRNTFKKNKIPFVEFKIEKIDEEALGEIFSYFMLETIIIGNLIGINPFDQQAVEQVKILTKKKLST